MEDIRTFHLRIIEEQLRGISGELTRVHFVAVDKQRRWRPRLNVYRCRDRMVICVELAGIDRSDIDLRAEPRRVWLGGRRTVVLPNIRENEPLQILALEIDDGSWEREIPMPDEIIPEEARAEQRNGLLWINLPLRFPR